MMNTNKGWTLTELLFSAAILAFALVSMLALFISCIFLNESNRNLVIAKSHAEFTLEEIKNTNFSDINSATWNTVDIIARGMSPLSEGETIDIDVDVIAEESLDVQATVNWKDRELRDRSMSLHTLVTKP